MKRALAKVGALGGVLVSGFVLARILLGRPPFWATSLGIVGVCLLFVFLWWDREDADSARSPKALQARATALFLVAMGACVAVLFNVVAARFDSQLDLSTGKRHTLSTFSVSAVQALKLPVEIIGLFPSGSVEEGAFFDLYSRFARESESLSLRLVDPLASPLEFDALREWIALENLGTLQVLFLTQNSEGVVENHVVLDGPLLEEDFVRAFTKLQLQEQRLVCFTQGHGERDLGERGNLADYGGIHERLLGANYAVGLVGPMRAVPVNCSVLVVAAPESALHPVTQEHLAAYVKAGGGLVVLLEPVLPGTTPSLPMNLSRYGFQVGEDLVIETHPDRLLAGVDSSHVVVDMASFDFHPIVNGLRRATVFQGARTVDAGPPIKGIQVQALAFSTEQGWAETNPASMKGEVEAVFDANERGRVPLMAVAEVVDPAAVRVGPTRLEEGEPSDFQVRVLEPGERPPGVLPLAEGKLPIGKVVVFGDADFISNRLVLGGVNHDLFLNTLSWMIDEEAPRGERAHKAGEGLMLLSAKQSRWMWRLVLGIVPGVCLLLGGFVAWRRRERLRY
jgi:hypothetical protein